MTSTRWNTKKTKHLLFDSDTGSLAFNEESEKSISTKNDNDNDNEFI